MLTALTNAVIFTGKTEITGKTLFIDEDRIISVSNPEMISKGARIIDCKGNFIAPGLIDLQVAGGGGFLFSENLTGEALNSIADSIVKGGTTGFLMVLPTNSFDIYRKAIKVVKENPHPALLGLHLEGPFINPAKRGAHMKEYIKKPDKEEIKELLEEANGVIKMMTLAPEVCDRDIIRLLKDYGVVISAGHSNATFEEAMKGFEWGIQSTTHLFNGMSPFHHRDTGLPGATFESDNISAGIIADGIHVAWDTLSISKKIMKQRLYLVTDAVEENNQGAYLHVKQKDRFTLPDGTLSGSRLSMIEAVKNCVEHAGIPLEEALRMASTYPAGVIKAPDKGEIAPGYKADLVIFNKDFKVINIYVNGIIY
jgi:N-acetylglucosamine-6-phosphate deacetylase